MEFLHCMDSNQCSPAQSSWRKSKTPLNNYISIRVTVKGLSGCKYFFKM